MDTQLSNDKSTILPKRKCQIQGPFAQNSHVREHFQRKFDIKCQSVCTNISRNTCGVYKKVKAPTQGYHIRRSYTHLLSMNISTPHFDELSSCPLAKCQEKIWEICLAEKKPRHPGSFLTRKSFLKSRQSLYIDVWETCNIGPREISRIRLS